MNFKRFALLPLATIALLLAACGGAKDTASAPAPGPGDGRPVVITANDKMMYSLAEIRAKPGEKISVTLSNTGSMPKQSMGHNWVLLVEGTNVMDFTNAAAQAIPTEYIPDKFKDAIIAHTRLLGPKESDTVTFTAPSTPGRNLFVCTFPGHFQVGMKGVLIVE
ncbi:MAG: azurin [Opitutaceae bacterium]|nr:azurin [Opitutaceae bacterium]